MTGDSDDGHLSGGGCRHAGLRFGWLRHRLLPRYGRRFLFAGHFIDDQPIGDVILIDIADVGYRLGANFFCRHIFDVTEPDVRVKSSLFSHGAQAGDTRRTRVIGGKGKQRFIEPGHGLIGIVPIHHPAHVFHAGMDIGIQLFNIAHLQLFSSAGHHLHNADGADVAPYRLIQPRLLVSLGRHQQPVDVITIAVLAEDIYHREEFASFLTRRGIFDIFSIFQVTQQESIAQRGALTILFDEVVQYRQQLRAVFAYRPGNVAALAQHHIVMDLNF